MHHQTLSLFILSAHLSSHLLDSALSTPIMSSFQDISAKSFPQVSCIFHLGRSTITMRLFWKIFVFSLGQVAHYNETTLKTFWIFQMDRSPIAMRPFEKKNLCILHMASNPWQFDHFKNLWILPIGKLVGTTIPLQKNISVFSLKILSFFFLRVHFLALVL